MDAKQVARQVAEGSIVLLKNEGGLLPLAAGKKLAIFGRAQIETILSGNGSGAARTENPSNILDECRKVGFEPIPALIDFYRQQVEEYAKAHPKEFDISKLEQIVNSGMMYEIFGKYSPPAPEFPVPSELVDAASQETDTALLVIGRNSGGEECDRHLDDDYYLTEAETALVEQVAGGFDRVIVVLNCNGLIDLSWVEKYPAIKSLIFLGAPGEQGPAALANILSGAVSPSGKLAVTIAKKYEDYPAAQDFSWDKDHPGNIRTYADYGLDAAANDSTGFLHSPVTVYREDIYLGYRYADTFGVKPLYPFGFGLSYGAFAISTPAVESAEGGVRVSAQVKNTGEHSGREVLQLYVSAFGTESQRPYQELKGFVKTGEMQPGQSETVSITLPWRELACYSERVGAWVIEKGAYLLRLGSSSDNTESVGKINVPEDILVQRTGNRLQIRECNRGKIEFLKPTAQTAPTAKDVPVFTLPPAQVEELRPAQTAPEDCSGYSIDELAALCVGYGPGLPFSGLLKTDDPNTIFDKTGKPVTVNDHPVGYNGYVSPAIESRGIHSAFYKDGPAGIGQTAWPTEMLLACSFDVELCRAFGDAVGAECQESQVDVWLAPALNLHRHPLGGRNFEYLSEDPFLAGACACAIAAGVQEGHPVLVCAKHFACNEQETFRRGSGKEIDGARTFDAVDSILTERAARELYLKPFEMLVRAGLHCMMTSFNKINGTFAGGSKDLCTHILREEWGFDGAVVTDWGDMDVVVDGADAVAAGNDIIMPGGPPVIRQILAGYEQGRVTKEELAAAAGHLLNMLKYLGRYKP